MTRLVQPEMLDSLPATAPEAVRSRRELRWINAIMGNHRWLRKSIRSHSQAGDKVLELGAGDGSLWTPALLPPSQWTALDLAPRPADWPESAHWLQEDLFQASLPETEIVVANLFLHHFTTDSLVDIGRKLPASCRLLIACEPARRALHQWQGRALSTLLQLSAVTRHDMLVSIRAGFWGKELPAALGLAGWKWRVSTTLLGAYQLTAWK